MADRFRYPKLGDTIRTVEPMKTATPAIPAGSYLRVRLDTPEAVEEARKLIMARRWCVEDAKGGAE